MDQPIRKPQQQGKLIDPVEAANAQSAEAKDAQIGREIGIESLSFDDFKAVPMTAARFVHPFEGYPLGKKIKVGEVEISSTFLVALRPQIQVFQDPSGKNVTIPKNDDKGRKIGERVVTIKSQHSRLLPDYEQGGRNTDVVFDRAIVFPDGRRLENCAIVASHSLRAQLMFKLGPKGQTQVDDRYVWVDRNQVSRLRRLWNSIAKPALKAERDAQAITGESNETLDDIPAE